MSKLYMFAQKSIDTMSFKYAEVPIGKATFIAVLFCAMILGVKAGAGEVEQKPKANWDAEKAKLDAENKQLNFQNEHLEDERKRSVLEDMRQDCRELNSEFNQIVKDLQEACGDFGITANCREEAEKCADSVVSSADDSSSMASGLSDMMKQMGGNMLGMGSLNSSSLGLPANAKCKSSKSIEKMKDTQERLYEDAKDSQTKAQEDLNKVQDEVSDITDAKSQANKDYRDAVKQLKEAQIELPQKQQELRDRAAAEAMRIQEALTKQIEVQAGAQKELSLAQSLVTRLYPSLMGDCMNQYRADTWNEDRKLLEMRKQFQEDLSKLDDLRQRNAKANSMQNESKIQSELSLKIREETYKVCVSEAKTRYNVEYKDLTARITVAAANIEGATKSIAELKRQADNVSKNLATMMQAQKEKNNLDRQDGLAEITSLEQNLKEQMTNFNNKVSRAQQNLTMKQYEMLKRESTYRQAQEVSEATLGNVTGLVESYNRNKKAMCDACEDYRTSKKKAGLSTKSDKVPPICSGGDSFDSYSTGTGPK